MKYNTLDVKPIPGYQDENKFIVNNEPGEIVNFAQVYQYVTAQIAAEHFDKSFSRKLKNGDMKYIFPLTKTRKKTTNIDAMRITLSKEMLENKELIYNGTTMKKNMEALNVHAVTHANHRCLQKLKKAVLTTSLGAAVLVGSGAMLIAATPSMSEQYPIERTESFVKEKNEYNSIKGQYDLLSEETKENMDFIEFRDKYGQDYLEGKISGAEIREQIENGRSR